MSASPSLESVLETVSILYNSPDSASKETASKWLEEFQKSIFAWEVSDKILQQQHSLESCYFAAQTMRTKIQYHFYELPAESHESLRNSLLDHISRLTSHTNQVIVTQLCLALADLTLQMTAWKNPLHTVVERFGNDEKHSLFLLDFMTVLPEESNSRGLRLGTNRRTDFVEELRRFCPVLVQLLLHFTEAQPTNPHIMLKVLKCLSSWFYVEAIPQECIVNSKLLALPFHVLCDRASSSSLHESASDCLCNAIFRCEDLRYYDVLSQVLMDNILKLEEAYYISVTDEDVDKSVNFCRIFTGLSESFIDHLTNSPGVGYGNLKMVDLLLACVSHPQYEVCEITFNFWYRLAEELYSLRDEERTKLFHGHIEKLISLLYQHCQLDTDHDGLPTEDSDFHDFRVKATETIKDAIFIVGPSNCFKNMCVLLGQQTGWEKVEAALFVMSAIARNISPDDDVVVPPVIAALLGLPAQETHIAVRYTCIHLLGELSEWISCHPSMLDGVLNFLQVMLHEKRLSSICALTLQKICSECQDQMAEHFEGLYQIVSMSDSFSLSQDAVFGLLTGISLTLNKVKNEVFAERMSKLCSFHIDGLKKVLHSPENTENMPSPLFWLDRLTVILRNVKVEDKEQHLCLPVAEILWPVLSETFTRYKENVRVVEHCCRTLRFLLRFCGSTTLSLLGPVATQIVTMYQEHPHSCFLYLGSILVDIFGSEMDCSDGLVSMFQAFFPETLKLLQQPNGIVNNPDTIDDMFRLCARYTMKMPGNFLREGLIEPMLMVAMEACKLNHREANASVMKWLCDVIRCGQEQNSEPHCKFMRSLIHARGENLVSGLLNACVSTLSSFLVADAAEVLHELLIFDKKATSVWLQNVLETLSKQNFAGIVPATPQQIADFHTEVTSSGDFRVLSRTMREFARLYK